MRVHRLLVVVAALLGAAACDIDDDGAVNVPDEPVSIVDLTELIDIDPGDVLLLRDDGAGGIEWIERRSGRIATLPDIGRFFDEPATAEDVEELAAIDVVGADGAPPNGASLATPCSTASATQRGPIPMPTSSWWERSTRPIARLGSCGPVVAPTMARWAVSSSPTSTTTARSDSPSAAAS